MQAPVIPKDLLEYLQLVYPNKLPERLPGPNKDSIEVLIGQQHVIAHLQSQYLMQNRNVLANK